MLKMVGVYCSKNQSQLGSFEYSKWKGAVEHEDFHGLMEVGTKKAKQQQQGKHANHGLVIAGYFLLHVRQGPLCRLLN